VVVRPLDIKVWDVDVLAEVKPEGKVGSAVYYEDYGSPG
jgi:hypothetical protein